MNPVKIAIFLLLFPIFVGDWIPRQDRDDDLVNGVQQSKLRWQDCAMSPVVRRETDIQLSLHIADTRIERGHQGKREKQFPVTVWLDKLEEVASPAAAGSGEPNLTHGADGHLYLSWIETNSAGGATLRFSVWKNEAWSKSRSVATGDDWFVNWADFPSVCALADGTLAAHWLQKSSGGTYSYDVKISLSQDHGKTWSKPLSPHRDGTLTEHGFVSLVPLTSTSFGVFWLDGRETDQNGDMALRFTTLSRNGLLGKDQLVDDRVCTCCQTSAVVLASGDPFVAYRGRTQDETRDIWIATVQRKNGVRRRTINPDGWVINGCPVNGPSTRRQGNTVVVAWPTVKNKQPEVRVSISTDSGKTFGPPIRVDDGNPLGRVDVALVNSEAAVVSWLESTGDTTSIRWRLIDRRGNSKASQQVAKTLGSRASGFPQLECFEGSLFFAWTDATKPARVRTARFPIDIKKISID
jgi:hypothetical protein